MEETEAEQVEYYVPPRIRKLEGITKQVLPSIFEAVPIILLCDNLEKLGMVEFRSFATEVTNLLPSSTLLVATANIAGLDPNTLRLCYDNFSVPLLMDKVDIPSKLREFVEARMVNHSKMDKPPISFDDKAIEALLDRTGGNLRESFRYCYFAVQRFKRDITGEMVLDAIRDCDAPRFEVLNETDRRLLHFLASEGEATLKQVFEAFKREDVGSKDAFRKRMDNLVTLGFVRKQLVKSGRTYEVSYTLPKTLKGILASY